MGSASESRAGRTAWLLSIVVAAISAVYDIFGIWFLIKDYDVVHSCKASNPDVHVVWTTNLWVYVLLSVLLSILFTIGIFMVPFRKSADAIQKQLKGRRRPPRDELDGRSRVKYGYLPSLPDWLLLAHGTALIMGSLLLGILAFCGYTELFVARPWCEDKSTAFEELDLWHFGRLTFFLQLIFSIVLFLCGVCYWMMPFFFELNEPDPGYGTMDNGRIPDRNGHSGP